MPVLRLHRLAAQLEKCKLSQVSLQTDYEELSDIDFISKYDLEKTEIKVVRNQL